VLFIGLFEKMFQNTFSIKKIDNFVRFYIPHFVSTHQGPWCFLFVQKTGKQNPTKLTIFFMQNLFT